MDHALPLGFPEEDAEVDAEVDPYDMDPAAVPNRARIALWEQALRDPTLKQGRSRLAMREEVQDGPWRQCCLDVACQVAMANGVVMEEVIRDSAARSGFVERGYLTGPLMAEFAILPEVVRQWYGFPSRHVPLAYQDAQLQATVINDEKQLPFPQIADLIRATYLTEANGEELK